MMDLNFVKQLFLACMLIGTVCTVSIPDPEMWENFRKVDFDTGEVKGRPDGQMYGSPTKEPGIRGPAIRFNPSFSPAQYLDFGDQRAHCYGNLELCNNGITVTFGVSVEDFSDGRSRYILSTGGQTGSSHGIAVLTQSGKVLVWFSTTTRWWKGELPVGSFNSSEWTFVAITWTNDDGLTVYLDAQRVYSLDTYETRSLASTSFNNFLVGTPNNAVGSYLGRFAIDRIFIYHRVLSQEQLNSLNEDGKRRNFQPVLKFNMNKMNGNLLVGKPNDGTTYGSPSLDRDDERGSRVLQLNMPDATQAQYVNLGNYRDQCLGTLNDCPTGLTLMVWLKAEDYSDGNSYYYISNGGQTRHSYGYTVLMQGRQLLVWVSTFSKWWKGSLPESATLARSWFHLAFTWTDIDGLTVYIGGVEVYRLRNAETRSISSSSHNDLYLGTPNNDVGTRLGQVMMDNLVIYDTVLPVSEIKEASASVA